MTAACIDKCAVETNVSTFRLGYPVKDSQGNAIDVPEGIQLEVQAPGANSFAIAGTCVFPEDTIPWVHGPDGKYIFRARAFMYAVKGPGSCGGSCKRFGPPSGNIGVTVKDARPTAPPAPIELVDCCGPMAGGMVAPTICMA